jgi:hypothetical protein
LPDPLAPDPLAAGLPVAGSAVAGVEAAGLEAAGLEAADPEAADLVASELDDGLYYLRHHCAPCAERHFDRARAHGATPAQVDAVRAAAHS